MKQLYPIIAAAGLVAASTFVSHAQPYAIAGDFNGWNNTAPLDGGPAIYTNIMTGGTPGSYQSFKVIAVPGSWSLTYPGNNVQIKYDAGGSNTVYFYPGTIVDGWSPVQNRVGYEDPGNMAWELTGDFTSPTWGGLPGTISDPNAQLISAGNGIYTNTYVITNAPGTYYFKFRTPGTWSEVNFGYDFGNGGGNASITTTNANQKILFQLDLPHGRWLAGNPVPPPVTNQVVFAVDMSSQMQLGQFHPDLGYSVFAAGAFNSWPDPPGGLALTNYPPYNGGSNTNIYYGTNTFVGAPGSSPTQYKFTQNDPAAPNKGWETSNDRTLTLLSANGTLMLPVVNFSDVLTSDFLTQPVDVTFRVDMNGAVSGQGTPTTWTGQNVYINGNFLANGWIGTWTPASLPQMTEDPPASGIYTFTYTVPAGNPVNIKYKYGFDDGVNTLDNEAPSKQDHGRTIRTTVTGVYTNALDKFGNQYVEPSFGQLSVGARSGTSVSLTWLGRPGVYVQSSSVLGGAWVNHYETDGTNWSNGSYSTNGLISSTNWPAGSNAQFFRLIKP